MSAQTYPEAREAYRQAKADFQAAWDAGEYAKAAVIGHDLPGLSNAMFDAITAKWQAEAI